METKEATTTTELHVAQESERRLVREKHEFGLLLESTSEQSNAAVKDLGMRLQIAEDDARRMNETFEAQTTSKDAEHAAVKASYEATISKLYEEADLRAKQVIDNEAEKDAEIKHVKKQLFMLRQDRERRANEFAVAQELSRRLMNAVGLDQSIPARTPLRNKAHSRTSKPDSAHQSGKSFFDSDHSHGSITPTPKRSKTDQPPVRTSLEGFKTSETLLGHKRSSSEKHRRPLAEISDGRNRQFDPSAQHTGRRRTVGVLTNTLLAEAGGEIEKQEASPFSFKSDNILTSSAEKPSATVCDSLVDDETTSDV